MTRRATVQVRLPVWIAKWASGVAETLSPDQLAELPAGLTGVSRTKLVEAAVLRELRRLDPHGRHSPFGHG